METKIKELIEHQINPQLKLHGGNCQFMSFKDGILTIKLFGGCTGCPSSQLVLFNSIAPLFREKFPNIKDILLA